MVFGNYYRLDRREAVDCVCDQKGDKGIDGIFVDDNAQSITVFGSRISQRSDRTAGETGMRELMGAMAQLRDASTVQAIIKAAPATQLGQLLAREKLDTKVGQYTLRGEFVTNINIDKNGQEYLDTVSEMVFVGKDSIISEYVSNSRDIPEHPAMTFDIFGESLAEYVMDESTKAIIVPIKAKDLVRMAGIADQSLFTFNVRGPLGRTQVNRDIVKTIAEPVRHKEFPLFHNGITVIAQEVSYSQETLTARRYYVVNGCQSITALFNSRGHLTDQLKMLVKFIQADPKSELAARVTEFSNTQNGVRSRDLKSNTPIQIRLKNEIKKQYAKQYWLEIKRGDPVGIGKKVSNEDAGLYLLAFDLGEPWATHRKYELFEDRHADIYGRHEVTADRIILLDVIMSSVLAGIPVLKNQMIARYALINYFVLYAIREILRSDSMMDEISANPGRFVRNVTDRTKFRECIDVLVKDIITDLNVAPELGEENFDYRGKLRSDEWVKRQVAQIVSDHRRLVSRQRMPSFKDEWEAKGAS